MVQITHYSGNFGVMHVLWLDFAVVLPLAAVLLGLLTWRHSGGAVRALVVAGLLAAPVGAYASFIEPNRLVRRVCAATAGDSPAVRAAACARRRVRRAG